MRGTAQYFNPYHSALKLSAGMTNANPLLKTEFYVAAIDSHFPDEGDYIASQWVPDDVSETPDIKIDEESPLNFGMTHPSLPEAESPIVKGGDMLTRFVEPGYWREKYVVRRNELMHIRRPGTLAELRKPAEILARKAQHLRIRLLNRKEWLRWRMLFGSIVINNENNVSHTWNYSFPSYLTPTLSGTARWDQSLTANPIENFRTWSEITNDFGTEFDVAIMNRKTMNTLLKSTAMLTFFSAAIQGGQLARGNGFFNDKAAQEILGLHVTGMPTLVVYDKGFEVKQTIAQYANVGAQQLVLDSAYGFEQNDIAYLKSTTGAEEKVTLNGGPVNNTVNLIQTLQYAYPNGSTIRAKKRYIPDGKVMLMPKMGGKVPFIGKFVSIPSEYAPGTMINPKAGDFFEIQDHSPYGDPKRIEMICGVYGIPFPIYRNVHAIATVF